MNRLDKIKAKYENLVGELAMRKRGGGDSCPKRGWMLTRILGCAVAIEEIATALSEVKRIV